LIVRFLVLYLQLCSNISYIVAGARRTKKTPAALIAAMEKELQTYVCTLQLLFAVLTCMWIESVAVEMHVSNKCKQMQLKMY
jgi:hypothetical protein